MMGYIGVGISALVGWMAIDYGSITGLLLSLLSGMLLFPPIWKWLQRSDKSIHWGLRWFLAALTAVAAVSFNGATPEGKNAAAEHKVAKAAKEKKVADALLARKGPIHDEGKESGDQCLSGWDGSFPDLKDAVKLSLRNPTSFKHVNTVRTPVGDKGTFGLIMTYRAENGFGGMNVEAIGVEVDAQSCKFKKADERSLSNRLLSKS